jgi:prepilin-type N-terminal cleavage/methylation domain-containing protein
MGYQKTIKYQGFTLIELILVMVILCTVLGMAGPSLRGFFSQRQIEDAGSSIIALAQYARSQAVCDGRTYRLNFDCDTRTYWLTVQEKGAFEDLNTRWGRVFILPTDISMETWDLELDRTICYASFSSLGRVTPGTIQLISPKGDKLSIVCRSATECFTVCEGEEQKYADEM